MDNAKKEMEEKEITKRNGLGMMVFCILGTLVSVLGFVCGIGFAVSAGEGKEFSGNVIPGVVIAVISTIVFIIFCIMFGGLKSVNPNEALVFTLFGDYYGTIKTEGFYWINPFVSAVNPVAKSLFVETAKAASGTTQTGTGRAGEAGYTAGYTGKKISLKTLTLNNEKQKVNDLLGNPIIVGSIVIWKIANPTSAVFEVDNYMTFLSTQCDSAMRNIARLYPYDVMEEDDDVEVEKTLRGSSQEVADELQKDLQERVKSAGIEIIDVRITHLAYAPEIAAAMLQRQQATAVIAARKKIVEGAVGMVEMALNQLSDDGIVLLDEERKAAMVSNLLVVLCGNKDAQPVVNSGSIY